jgi:hypothetical protein
MVRRGPRNLLRGKGVEIEGLRALEAKLDDLMALGWAGGSARARAARQDLHEALRGAAEMVKSAVRTKAMAAGWPKATVAAIFSYADPRQDKPARSNALAGIRKGAPPRKDDAIYREWFPGRSQSRRAKRLIIPGDRGASGLQKIGMSLATMFEFGTSKMAARPAFRPAIAAIKTQVVRRLAEGYRRVIEGLATQ